jgi:hypothetical protein
MGSGTVDMVVQVWLIGCGWEVLGENIIREGSFGF